LSLGNEHSFQLSDKSMLYLNPSISRGIDAFDALNDDESGLDLSYLAYWSCLEILLDKSFWLWCYQMNQMNKKSYLMLTLDWCHNRIWLRCN
jgi:hypothetical protein